LPGEMSIAWDIPLPWLMRGELAMRRAARSAGR
jgi:hypothetical protein